MMRLLSLFIYAIEENTHRRLFAIYLSMIFQNNLYLSSSYSIHYKRSSSVFDNK